MGYPIRGSCQVECLDQEQWYDFLRKKDIYLTINKGITKEQAMEKYIDLATGIIERYST